MSWSHVALATLALAALLIGFLVAGRERRARLVAEEELARLGGGLLKVQEAERARIARSCMTGSASSSQW